MSKVKKNGLHPKVYSVCLGFVLDAEAPHSGPLVAQHLNLILKVPVFLLVLQNTAHCH